MPHVGFYGGSAVRELGPVSDMKVFFDCVGLAASRLPSGGGLLTDRLYRRYLRLEEFEPALNLISQIQTIFSDFSATDIDWRAIGWDATATQLNLAQKSVAEVFHRYLKGAREIIENAQSFEKRFQSFKPVMTIISDIPRFVIDRNRPLAFYDTLEGEPMWLR